MLRLAHCALVRSLVPLWQEQEKRSGRQGLRAGSELRLRAVLQEQEKLSGRQGLKAGAESPLGW